MQNPPTKPGTHPANTPLSVASRSIRASSGQQGVLDKKATSRFEIPTTQLDAAQAFYETVLGYLDASPSLDAALERTVAQGGQIA